MLPFSMQEVRSNPIATLHRLTGEQRRLLLRAAGLLTVASAAVALVPFRRALSFGCVGLGDKSNCSIADYVWAVRAAARRLPWRTKCIEQGLALQRMLRLAGVDATLHYGARHDPHSGKLEAHVWVSVGGEVVIGGEEAAGFAEIAAYPLSKSTER
jgi:hypothetical protein